MQKVGVVTFKVTAHVIKPRPTSVVFRIQNVQEPASFNEEGVGKCDL